MGTAIGGGDEVVHAARKAGDQYIGSFVQDSKTFGKERDFSGSGGAEYTGESGEGNRGVKGGRGNGDVVVEGAINACAEGPITGVRSVSIRDSKRRVRRVGPETKVESIDQENPAANWKVSSMQSTTHAKVRRESERGVGERVPV